MPELGGDLVEPGDVEQVADVGARVERASAQAASAGAAMRAELAQEPLLGLGQVLAARERDREHAGRAAGEREREPVAGGRRDGAAAAVSEPPRDTGGDPAGRRDVDPAV